MAGNQQKPRVVDNPNVQETYVNKTIGASFDGSAISLILGCTRVVPEKLDTLPRQDQPPSVYVTGRIVLSPAAGAELANALNGILTEISRSQKASLSKPN